MVKVRKRSVIEPVNCAEYNESMKAHDWIALVDIFDLFHLKRYCTEEELKQIEKALEMEIFASLIQKHSPEIPTEEETIEVIAEVKKNFIVEYISESENKNAKMRANKVEQLLLRDDATPEQLEREIALFYEEEQYE